VLFAAGSNFTDAQVQANGLAYGLLQRHAAMLAFVDDFWMMGLMFLILIPMMFMMKKARPQGTPISAH
jgi:lipoprotein signal peptidase